jgi:hypothetical protein
MIGWSGNPKAVNAAGEIDLETASAASRLRQAPASTKPRRPMQEPVNHHDV